MKLLKSIFKWFLYFIGLCILVFIALLIIPEKEIVKPIQPRKSTRYWQMEMGFEIAYTHLPAKVHPAKAPIVFLHGGPGGYVHSSIIQTLDTFTALGHDVFLYDQRGSGLSDRMPKFSDINFEYHIRDLHEIITEKIKSDMVVLIGQSFGTILAAHYSARYPRQVEKIVLCSPGTLLPNRKINGAYANIVSLYPSPDSLQFTRPYNFVKDVDNMAIRPKAIVATLGALLLDKKLISDKQMDRMLNTLSTQFIKGMVCKPESILPQEGGGGLYAFLATNNGNLPEIRDQIKEVKAPVLVLQGQCEYHPFASAYEYVDLYPDSRYRFIDNAGHEIWWEQPEVFKQEIAAFLASDLPTYQD